jgi:MFS family permease
MQQRQPFYYIFLLILAAESVFILPFVLPRIFRPTVLELFQVNNLQLGYCFSIYGVIALISYFFGGLIADKFSPGKMMGIALVMTALGGFVLGGYPNLMLLKFLYGYWGCTTILLFWAAMIKATRIWGGEDRQGKAFGFLDGGRGLVAAGFGSLGIFVLSLYISGDFDNLPFEEKRMAFKNLIWTFSTIILIIGVLVYFFLNTDQNPTKSDFDKISSKKNITLKDIKFLLKIPIVWLIMIIILTGYCGYKITDIFSLYANEVMMFNEVDSANIGTSLLYLRPVIGISVGFLADRTRPTLWLTIGFLVMALGSLVMASGIIGPSTVWVFGLVIFVTALGVYAIRCLYFAILEEGKIPGFMTGTVVGLVSLIGYTPDIFMGPVIGVLLDENPGELGHQYVFGLIMILSVIGLVAVLLFRRWSSNWQINASRDGL